jgi:hypothetical protein
MVAGCPRGLVEDHAHTGIEVPTVRDDKPLRFERSFVGLKGELGGRAVERSSRSRGERAW